MVGGLCVILIVVLCQVLASLLKKPGPKPDIKPFLAFLSLFWILHISLVVALIWGNHNEIIPEIVSIMNPPRDDSDNLLSSETYNFESSQTTVSEVASCETTESAKSVVAPNETAKSVVASNEEVESVVALNETTESAKSVVAPNETAESVVTSNEEVESIVALNETTESEVDPTPDIEKTSSTVTSKVPKGAKDTNRSRSIILYIAFCILVWIYLLLFIWWLYSCKKTIEIETEDNFLSFARYFLSLTISAELALSFVSFLLLYDINILVFVRKLVSGSLVSVQFALFL